MKAPKLIASIAAVLLTSASLSALNYHVDARQAAPSEINGIRVINLPAVHVYAGANDIDNRSVVNLSAVQVYPDPVDMDSATARTDAGFVSHTLVPSLNQMRHTGTESLSLIGSQLVMPYYSFGQKFGGITKE